MRVLVAVAGLAAQQREMTTGAQYLLSALAGSAAVQGLDAAACNASFGRLDKMYLAFTELEATTSGGVVFASSLGASRKGVDLSGRGDIREAMRDLRFRAGDVTVERTGGGRLLHFSYPVLDVNGKLLAILTAGFEVGGGEYARLVAKMHLPPGFSVNYADRDGMRIWRLPASKAASPGKSIGDAGIAQIRGKPDQEIFERTGVDGVLRICAFAPLRLEDKAPPYMYIIGGVSKSAVTGQANRAVWLELLALGAIGLLVLSLNLFMGNLFIVRPIQKLVTAAQRLGRGEESVRTGLAHTPDDFGRLARSFDEMAMLLEKSDAERRSAQEALAGAFARSEAMVRERTAELSRTCAALTAEIAEHGLAEKERKRLIIAIEQSADAIVITDTNYVIKYVNPAFKDVSGYEPAEALGRHLGFFKCSLNDGAFYERIKETLNAGGIWTGCATNRKKDGALNEIEASLSPVHDESGVLIGFVGNYRDISIRLKLERELRQMQKMEALGAMAGGVAHDFNNIIGAILGHVELALRRLPKTSPARGNLENVLHAAECAADLVKRILTTVRLEERPLQPVAIAPLVEETLKLMAPSLPANITVRGDMPANHGEMVVLADPTEVQRVLMNLCKNAAHAMFPNGGVMGIGLSKAVVSSSGQFEGPNPMPGSEPSLEPGVYMCLAVSDTGAGIAPAVMEKLFDPYFTTKPGGEGTGLGLSVVRGIVRTYGGEITVCSEPGRGAAFGVFLRAFERRKPVELRKSFQGRPDWSPVRGGPTAGEAASPVEI